ncbi:flagellar biosynthetic protein FliO [Pseudohongiella sp.]|uniref:Flagellar protein n=1 Tax=marine sediment metagenome TaxID=412755 RepID=A0A0F9W2Y0_9ZZZZ|nr:flagellar biosynthetic protein FliO [Pseudohongiella sp.]HDZ09940.1 flagellar biosynthetic protein FliO [Pseudohongiella sp.]HEA64404.1 flagellar biosynthetic protein FliO [Pseudohongiella sp.]
MAESATLVDTARQSAETGAGQGAIFAGGSDAMLQTAIWLLVIVGMILVLAWAVRRFTNIGPRSVGAMRVLSALPVGNRERIALVQVGDKQLLIGVAPGHVSTLHVFDENIVSAQPASTAFSRPADSSSRNFGQVLRNTLRSSSGTAGARDSN